MNYGYHISIHKAAKKASVIVCLQEGETKKKKKRNSDYNYESGSDSDASLDSTAEPSTTEAEKKEESKFFLYSSKTMQLSYIPVVVIPPPFFFSKGIENILAEGSKKEPLPGKKKNLPLDSENTEKKEEDDNEVDKEEGEEETQPRALHQTCSIFLRNLAPTITKQEVEAVSSFFSFSVHIVVWISVQHHFDYLWLFSGKWGLH